MRASRRGNALLLVLLVTSALAGLTILAARLAVGTSDRVREEAFSTQHQNQLEAAIELFRLELVRSYATSGQPAVIWVATVPLNQRRVFAPYPGCVCWVSRSSAGQTGSQWLELTASTEPSTRTRLTVRQLINFDRSTVFDLAILCETTDCMACHLQVRGEWGTLLDGFRPGHDKVRSGYGTQALGRLYSKGSVVRAPGEAAGGNWVNGAEFTGGVEENSTSAKLPVDEDTGEIALPRLKPLQILTGIKAEMAAGRTVGIGSNPSTPLDSSTMAEMYALPHFEDTNDDGQPAAGEWVKFTRNTTPGAGVGVAAGDAGAKAANYRVQQIPPVWDGNLVLIGTADKPIVLNGDVYVTGDVVIKGVVTGKGAIYAGRNTYVAGDVTYKNPPAAMMAAIRGDGTDPDLAAQADLATSDELRLAARANVVLGDYVETAAGEKLPIRDRQAADYFRQQFGFTPSAPDGGQRYFLPFQPGVDGEAVPSLEVKPDPVNPGMFRPFDWRPQDGGEPIDGALVRKMDGYEALRPRVLEDAASGAGHDWISDDSYRNVLGTQQLDLNTYRGFVPAAPVSGTNAGTTLPGGGEQTERVNILQNELGLPNTQLLGDWRGFARWVDDWYAGDPNSLVRGVRISFDPNDPSGAGWDAKTYDQSLVTLFKKGVFNEKGQMIGYTLRVLDERVQSYPDQTENVDAFLYSNSRIAGLTQAGTSLTVNGGMISSEIGVLAPGRRAVLDTSMDAWQAGAASGETGTSGLWNEDHWAWRSAEGLTTQGVPWPSNPAIAPDGLSVSGPISAFDGNYSRVQMQIWYQEDPTVVPAWTQTVDHPAIPASDAWTETVEHPATPGTPPKYYAQVWGGTKQVLVGTGYGTEYRTVYDPTKNYWSPAFATSEEAAAWAAGELSKNITARPATDAPEETKARGGGWGGTTNSWTNPGTPGTAAWTETIEHAAVVGVPGWTETIEHPEQTLAGAWRQDFNGWKTVEDFPGAVGVNSEADLRAFLDSRLAALAKPPGMVSISFVARDKYKRWGYSDKLNGWNWLDGSTTERDAFLNRWWKGNITLADGRKLNLRSQGGQVNGANGEKFGGAVVNYDFRLRNGGLGFNRIGDDVGKRLVWLPVAYQTPPP